MKRSFIAIAIVVGVAVTAVVTTGIALESGEVAVLYTRTADGSWRATRVWVADDDGRPLIEAASPDRPFHRDIERDPNVELERDGARRPLRATVLAQPDGHRRIRAALRAKYGWKDWWIGWLADTSESLAIRLGPRTDAAEARS